MLFHSSIRQELARSFGATFVVLITIVMTMTLIHTLGQATRGSINPADVIFIMGYSGMGRLPMILTLSLFIAIVATLSRMYQDSEMVIWFCSGRGLGNFLRPLFRFAMPIWIMITVIAFTIWPWANQQINELRTRYESRGDLERISPGQFQTSSNGQRVFFIDKDTTDGKTGRNVFISAYERDQQFITSARSGRTESINGKRFLILNNGQRLQLSTSPASNGEFKLSEFQEYGLRLDNNALDNANRIQPRALSTLQLIRNPDLPNMGELAWRLGLSLAALNLIVIALSVASTNPRISRSGNLLFALCTFILYYNLISLGQSWISTGKAQFAPFLLMVHGGILLLASAWLAKRHWGR